MRRFALLLVLLVVMAFSLAAWLQPRLVRTTGGRDADNVFKILLGDGRRMFANHFFVKADVYFHKGSYPSIFDQAAAADESGQPAHAEDEHDHEHDDHDEDAADGHEHDHEGATGQPDIAETNFRGQSRDWIEAFGRHFFVTKHSHLEGGKEREMLPWLKLSAELDPQNVEIYTVAAYWLADRMDRPKEAEEFLREGLRANPKSYEILFQLGHIYEKHYKQLDRARNVWEAALRKWDEVEAVRPDADNVFRERILVNLAKLEADQGNYLKSIQHFEEAKQYTPLPDALEERINEVWLQFTLPPPTR